MKTKRNVLTGFAVLFLVAIFIMAGCDTGMGGGAESVTYRTTSEGKTYTLVITASSGRAAYTPQKGDRYVFTVTPGNTRSVGTVASSAGTTLTLKPENATSSFTVTVKEAGTEGTGGEISVITGTVTLEDGNTLPSSGIVKPGSGGGGGSRGGGGTIDGGDDNFPLPLTSVERAGAYYVYLALKGDGRGSVDNPLVLPMKMDLGNGVDSLANLFSLIATKGKYVDLNLAGCSMNGTEFDPDWESSTGKGRVVSLTLPDAAESIKAGNQWVDDNDVPHNTGTFEFFDHLKHVGGRNIKTIGAGAFYSIDYEKNDTTLTFLASVDFPAATDIGGSAFNFCKALTTVNLPAAVTIGDLAFYACALTTVDFPSARHIGGGAFSSSSSNLTTVNLPQATSIGATAFQCCEALETVNLPAVTSIGYLPFIFTYEQAITITLPKAAPVILSEKDTWVDWTPTPYSKTITIKLPADSTGYDPAWVEIFKTNMCGPEVTIDLYFEDL